MQPTSNDNSIFIAHNSTVVGIVSLGKNSSVWYHATIRADEAPISIGDKTNVQDNAVLHTDKGQPLRIGDRVTIGHSAVLHSCCVEDDCLIGIGAIILNNAHIGCGSIVGAGSLVTAGKKFPPGSLILGSPAKVVRQITEEKQKHNRENIDEYVRLAKEAKTAH